MNSAHPDHVPLAPWVTELKDVDKDLIAQARDLDEQFFQVERLTKSMFEKITAKQVAFLGEIAHVWSPEEITAAKTEMRIKLPLSIRE